VAGVAKGAVAGYFKALHSDRPLGVADWAALAQLVEHIIRNGTARGKLNRTFIKIVNEIRCLRRSLVGLR